jgi:MFS family permease
LNASIGAVSNLWSAIAVEWNASANLVAGVTGVMSGIISAFGCALAGWLADRANRCYVFLAMGGLLGLVSIAIAVAPRTPVLFAAGTLGHAMVLGMCQAAFSALALGVIGRGAAASKYAVMSAIGNLPASYMTALDGWVHDRWSAAGMLIGEALLYFLCIAAAMFAIRKLRLLDVNRNERVGSTQN